MSLVSFVMPVWNPNPDWLRLAVRSALDQRGCRVEVLVVDDGCPEPVERTLGEIRDERLRVLRIEHGGECAARNAGLEASAGDRIRFVDADDMLEPNSTERLLRLIGDDDGTIAYGATMFCDSTLRPRWKLICRSEGPALEDCLLGRFTVRPFSLLFPRAVVEATGDWDPAFHVSQDWDYVLRALEHARVRGETEVATYYRKHPRAATAADVRVAEAGGRRVLDKFFERHPEQRGTALERKAEARLQAVLARAYATHRQRRRALRGLVEAVRLDPGAVAEELRRSVPAVAAELRARVTSRPAVV
jgi:glycosyltransferase involved in cell wall biosynthesis